MPATDRIPVLVYDDGTPNGATTMDRALTVASHIVLANTHHTPNHTRNIEAADHHGIPVHVHNLAEHQGIRHALALCAHHDIHLAYVPHPGQHPGQQLRKIIQAAANTQTAGLPVLAIHIVNPNTPNSGPILEIDPAHTNAGFTALFAAGLAATTNTPLHILRLAGDRTNADQRAKTALHQARQLIVDNDIPTYDHPTHNDPTTTALHHANNASVVVLGIGGITITGRKPTAPDELPNSILEQPDGQLAHQITQHTTTDLVIVCDDITTHNTPTRQAAILTAALGTITAATITAGTLGLALTSAALAAAATAHTKTTGPPPNTLKAE